LTGAWVLASALVFAPPAAGAGAPTPDDEGEVQPDGDEDAPRSPAYADVLEPLPEDQRDEGAAKQLMASAKTAFRDERYEEAIEFLAEAYRTDPYVTLLYSLGSAHRRAYETHGDVEHRRLSIRRYQQYLSEAPDAEYADLAQNYLTSLLAERDLGDIEMEVVTRILVSTAAEDAVMTLDGGKPLPAPGVMTVEPGAHELTVRAPGYHEFVRSFDVPEGTTFQVQAELDERPGDIVVEGPRGAWVRVDGRVVGKLPLAATVSVEPGVHVVTVTKNGHDTFSQDLELDREGWSLVRAKLDVSNQRVASYFLMGLGAAGLAAGGVQLGFALDRQRQALVFADQRETDQLTTEEYDEYLGLADQRNALRTGALISGISGGALLLTGVVLFAYDNPRLAAGRVAARRFDLRPTPTGVALRF
jgi:tetratricopeptide (TPR) repeat protein